jgi:hypothetical protein
MAQRFRDEVVIEPTWIGRVGRVGPIGPMYEHDAAASPQEASYFVRLAMSWTL